MIETRVRSEENNLGLYVRDSDEMLLKGVKKVGIISIENLSDRKDFKKNSQNEFRDRWQGKKMMDSLQVRCPKRLIKIYLASGWCKVTSKYKMKQLFAPQNNKH